MLAITTSLSVNGALAPTEFSGPSAAYLHGVEQFSALVRTCANQSNEYAGKKHEDERLQECDEQFEDRYADRHRDRQWNKDPGGEREDQCDQRKENDVPANHVGEETDRESERLRQLSNDLDRCEDRRDEELHA